MIFTFLLHLPINGKTLPFFTLFALAAQKTTSLSKQILDYRNIEISQIAQGLAECGKKTSQEIVNLDQA